MASLPTLADLADVEDRLGRLIETSEQARADAMLRDASTVVRSYCRRNFTQGTTTARLRPRGRKVLLPQRPVLAVTAVASVQAFGTTEIVTPMALWSWVGGHELIVGDQALVINGPTVDWSDENVWVEVTYDHGFAEVPDDIVTVVANMVVRNLTVPSGGLIDSETIGPYTTRYSGFTSAGPLGLSEGDRIMLNRYRTTATSTVELRS